MIPPDAERRDAGGAHPFFDIKYLTHLV